MRCFVGLEDMCPPPSRSIYLQRAEHLITSLCVHCREQVLPALPEKGISSTVDGSGEPKPLSPLDTLEAHQKGAAVMAASPDGRFMATGGADGLVCLWMIYESQVRKRAPPSVAALSIQANTQR